MKGKEFAVHDLILMFTNVLLFSISHEGNREISVSVLT